MEIGFDWRRERVGRTLTTVEAGAEKERTRIVDLAAVGEAVGEALVWTQRWSGRWSVWRRGGRGGGAGAQR
jgi:hypothetical protein